MGECTAHRVVPRASDRGTNLGSSRDAVLRAGLVEGRDFTAIDSERFAAPLYRLGNRIRGGPGVGWTTIAAVNTLSYYYFEWLVWKRFGEAIRRREFDLVHRITRIR